jgi:hypothetical protein
MKKTIFIISVLMIMSLILSACQAPAAAQGATVGATQIQTENVTPTLSVTKTIRPTLTGTSTPVSNASLAETSAKTYFKALQDQDFKKAADQVSDFSLTVFNLTRADLVDDLTAQLTKGAAWTGLDVLDSEVFSETVIFVHVSYTKDTKSSKADEVWPFRFEKGQWRYNWKNLIDFKSLQTQGQTMNGITVKPTEIFRYTDHLDIKMLVQNRTNDTIVFGQQNEILANFHFGEKTVEAEKVQLIFSHLQSYPDVTIQVKGFYTQYPDSVDVRKWKNYNVKPWYVFTL